MNDTNRLSEQLNQPFPLERNSKKDWIIILSVSLFIALFMAGFKPFGLQKSHMEYKHLFLAGYGAVTFLVLVLFLRIIPPLFKSWFVEHLWTVKKHIVWLTLLVFTIGVGNYVYTISLTEFFAWNWRSFLLFQFFTLVIGIIPVTVMTLADVNYNLKKNLAMAQSLNREIHEQGPHTTIDRPVELSGKNKNEKLSLSPNQIFYVQSEGNYIRICYEEEGKVHKPMIRSTLSGIKEQLQEAPGIIQCHRTFLVNSDKIAEARGNAQGFSLRLHGTDETVPVSRKYVPLIRQSIAR